MTATDHDLVRATIAGDLKSFERLVERHREVVLRVAARIVGEDDAEDVAQDAFLRAYHRLTRWRGDAPFRTWLLHIAHNSAIDALHARKQTTLPLEESAHEVPGASVGWTRSSKRSARRTVPCSSCATSKGSPTRRSPPSPRCRWAA